MKKTNVVAMCISFVLVALMLALLVMQFVPFWSESKGPVSISDYIWMPGDHMELNVTLKAQFGKDYRINQIVLAPAVLLVSAAAGIVISLLKRGKFVSYLIPIVCGVAGITAYFTYPPFKLGENWTIHAVLSIAVLAVAVIGAVVSLLKFKKK